MDKEHQPESLTTVTIKPEYPPSEIYSSSEAPPAYVKHVYASVQVAKIIAVTIVSCSVILGFFLLASAYVTANASCKQLEQELDFLGDVAERFQPPSQAEALIQRTHSSEEEPDFDQSQTKEFKTDVITSENTSDSSDNKIDKVEEDRMKERNTSFKLPLHLILDDLAEALLGKDKKTQMKCVLEKRKEEQFVDRQLKTIVLPFGLNAPTSPHLEKVSGEKLAIFCESGSAQSEFSSKSRNADDGDKDGDQLEESIMIQPVMIPVSRNNLNADMVQQNMPQEIKQMFAQIVPQVQIQEHIMIRPHQSPQLSQFDASPKPLDTMRPPIPFASKIQDINSFSDGFPPHPVLRQIAEQIVAQKMMNIQNEKNEESNQQVNQPQGTTTWGNNREFPVVNEVFQKMLIPEVILNHINSLSAPNDVIVAISGKESSDSTTSQDIRDEKGRIVQEPRTNPLVMNGRQSYARAFPSEMSQSMMNQLKQNTGAHPGEEFRPHHLQPRSVRNRRDVRIPIMETSKRVKRCSCDCAC